MPAIQSLGSLYKKKNMGTPILWYDLKEIDDSLSILTRLSNTVYSGVILSWTQGLETLLIRIPTRLTRVIQLHTLDQLNEFVSKDFPNQSKGTSWVICSNELEVLKAAKKKEFSTCFRSYIDDNQSLNEAIERGQGHSFLMMCFKDPTNIPLELVIASLQFTETKVIKEIPDPENIDDAIVSLDVMEVGADGVVFSPKRHEVLDLFLNKLGTALCKGLKIEIGEITKSVPVGIGHRACIDLATLFSQQEGILVGSTSQGGILCCPEVFHLPYMELRPFRVNAGGVHSYVYNIHNRTNYISELKAGDPLMVVDITGKARPAVVGRIKIEVRPLRLIETRFNDVHLSILLQDDWHVRVYSDEGTPLNISELRIGQKVLGYLSTPGRHVGIPVEESIVEK